MAAKHHVAHMVRYILNDDNEDDNNIYHCAFHYMCIERPSDFLGLMMEDMQGIDVYQTDAHTRMIFNIAHRRCITRLMGFWHSLPVESRSWTTISYDEFEGYLATQRAERGGIDYARLGREIAAAIPRPLTATEITTAVVGAVPDTAAVAAAVAGALPGAHSAVDSFKKGSKQSVADYKILQKISQWTSWRQATVTTGCDHGVAEIFDPTYIPDGDAAIALFDEQQKFMFSVFATTLKESSAASLYDTYAIEGDDNYGNAQLICHDLVQLFSEGQAGKALQRSLEREIDSLRLDHTWTKTYLAFYNATNAKMVNLHALTSRTNYPDSWCISKINECFNTNSQMHTFISNLESSTNQVLSMATTIAAAASGIVPTAIPDVTYEEHMSRIREHCILIDTERALTAADKKGPKPSKRLNAKELKPTILTFPNRVVVPVVVQVDGEVTDEVATNRFGTEDVAMVAEITPANRVVDVVAIMFLPTSGPRWTKTSAQCCFAIAMNPANKRIILAMPHQPFPKLLPLRHNLPHPPRTLLNPTPVQ